MKKEEYDILSTVDGDYKTTFTKKYRERKPWKANNPKDIISFIPGTITSIEVEIGQKVEVGDVLVVFNAMKMSNTFKSPVAGRIAKINVQANQVVPKGVTIIEFE